MKKCYLCKQVKPLSEFHIDRSKKDGKTSRCKECEKIYSRRYNQNHRMRDWKKYGIKKMTISRYSKLLKEQKYKCAICGVHLSEIKKKNRHNFSVDHNHNTGEARGLLCNKCNFGIAHFNEDIFVLKRAIMYLFKYQ